jgi:hypothetical protein
MYVVEPKIIPFQLMLSYCCCAILSNDCRSSLLLYHIFRKGSSCQLNFSRKQFRAIQNIRVPVAKVWRPKKLLFHAMWWSLSQPQKIHPGEEVSVVFRSFQLSVVEFWWGPRRISFFRDVSSLFANVGS